MKKLTIASIFFLLFTTPVIAMEADKIELLAGVEAGIDSDTAMTLEDLEKTQEILSKSATGSLTSWYNIDTTTHYDVKVGQHYHANLRPCVAYDLTTKHSSTTENQHLKACLNYEGRWISKIDI